MAKVFIGVGHGGDDPGAVKYLVEKDINLKMAKAMRDYLQACGVETMISRETDVTDRLYNKIQRCNAFNPDLAIDVHNNAGAGDGFEVLHSINGGKGKTLAKSIEEEVLKIGQNSRGLKTRADVDGTDYFGFIRETYCPAVICEGVFVDNASDAAQADTDEECKQFGEAYARGFLKTLGIKDTNADVTTNKKTKTNVAKYFVRRTFKDTKTQKGAYVLLSNAKKQCNKYVGYNVYDKNGKCVHKSTNFSEYKIKIEKKTNIYKTANKKSIVVGTVDNGIFTIIKEENGMGYLKSKIGYVSLDDVSEYR